MKIAASFLVFLTGIVHVYASAGPPPFTNGSPLVSGVDGSYQATARGRNLTGVFRFTYANGVQTSSPQLPTGNTVSNLLTDPYNDYVFFVEGKVYRGLVQANVNVGSVAGVLDNGAFNVLGADSFTSTRTVSPSPTVSPTATPPVSPTPTPTVTPTVTPTPDGTATPTPDGTATPTPDGTATPTPDGTATPTPDGTATPTPDGTATPTPTVTPTATPTVTPTVTPTQPPLVITSNEFLSGFFNGSIDQNSPYAAFHGRGEVTITGTAPVNDSDDSFATAQLFTRKFKFRGVRNATGTTTTTTTTTSS
jgi:hypothetical protein